MRAISVHRMSYKDARAKQTQDYCDFNQRPHLLWVRR
jgi:hypothetical protein